MQVKMIKGWFSDMPCPNCKVYICGVDRQKNMKQAHATVDVFMCLKHSKMVSPMAYRTDLMWTVERD